MFLELGLIFVLAMVLIKLIIVNALRLGLVDVPNERSMHMRHHPRGAGIGFFLAVALVEPFFHAPLLTEHVYLLLAIAMIFVVGVLDDHQDTAPNTKFIVLAIASVLVCLDGICIENVGTFFGVEMMLGWFALPFTVLSIVGVTNALNLIDGLDGLAGSISIVILLTFFVIGMEHQDALMLMLSAAFIVSLSAFLIYNWNPASIFMGDSGSLVLGFVIAVLASKATHYVHPVSLLFIVAVPLMDTFIVMIRRKVQGRSMFSADKTHLHHIIYGFFNKDIRMSTLLLIVLQAIYSITGLMIVDHANQTLSLILFLLNVILLYFITTGILRRQSIIDAKCKQ